MFDTVAKVVFSKASEHWEGLLTVVLIILYGRNDYRVSKLEKAKPCVFPETCKLQQLACKEREIALKAELAHGTEEFQRVREDIKALAKKQDEQHDCMVALIIGIKERHSQQRGEE